MPRDSTSQAGPPPRRLGQVPWSRDGSAGLSILALSSVPPSDDSMIRAAVVRGARSSGTIAELDRSLNRELWQIGYVARLEHDPANPVVLVEISTGY
jgi:hypothetical protein